MTQFLNRQQRKVAISALGFAALGYYLFSSIPQTVTVHKGPCVEIAAGIQPIEGKEFFEFQMVTNQGVPPSEFVVFRMDVNGHSVETWRLGATLPAASAVDRGSLPDKYKSVDINPYGDDPIRQCHDYGETQSGRYRAKFGSRVFEKAGKDWFFPCAVNSKNGKFVALLSYERPDQPFS